MLRWEHWKLNDIFPTDAFLAGYDIDDSPIYIGRAFHESDQIPGKIVPHRNIASVCYNGIEYGKRSLEVLCGNNFEWVVSEFGRVPPNAICGGRTSDGEVLYIGRKRHLNSLTPGKIHPSNSCLYIPFGGLEIAFERYEVLVEKTTLTLEGAV